MQTAIEEYIRRHDDRQRVASARERTHARLGNAKMAIVVGALGYGAFTLGGEPQLVVYVSAASVYLAIAVWHELTIRALARANAAARFYLDGIARIEDRWIGIGQTGERFRERDHPYADDLDLFGDGSLFQLLSGARTPMGEERLASWLRRAATPSEIALRHARVSALRENVDLRERIAVVNAGSARRMAPDRLMAWAATAATLPRARALVILMAVAFVATLVLFLRGGGALPMGFTLLAEAGLVAWLGRRANAVVESLSSATGAAGLDLLSRVIREVEHERVPDADLAALFGRLTAAGPPAARASQAIAALARIADWSDSRHNVFTRLLEIPALYTLQVAYAAEAWRRRYGASMADWVEVVAETEALLSISGYAFEHPADPFPAIVEQAEALFEGNDVGHPLIPAATAVRNSVTLGGPSQVLLVSGSNMAGKSTLLRTVGLNVVLALAGAPVRAATLTLSPLALGTCLRHTDSLHEGRSGFYTEVLRLRLVSDLLDGPAPLVFLFDELLSGTNSSDRRIAAEGIVRSMVERGAIGMVTTHDLALTEIANVLPGRVRNVHLQDHVEDGKMRFDYKLRDGVIEHSNALELMRMIGLDV